MKGFMADGSPVGNENTFVSVCDIPQEKGVALGKIPQK
jgi:hypothetical protein